MTTSGPDHLTRRTPRPDTVRLLDAASGAHLRDVAGPLRRRGAAGVTIRSRCDRPDRLEPSSPHRSIPVATATAIGSSSLPNTCPVSGSSRCSGRSSAFGAGPVKPWAKPTLVRTQHLPPCKTLGQPLCVRSSGTPKVHGLAHRRFIQARHGSSPASTALTCSDTPQSRTCRIPVLQTAPVPGVRLTEQARNTIGHDRHSAVR